MRKTNSQKEQNTMKRIREHRRKQDELHCDEPCSVCRHNRKHAKMGGQSQCICQSPIGTHTKVYIKRIINRFI